MTDPLHETAHPCTGGATLGVVIPRPPPRDILTQYVGGVNAAVSPESIPD